jgi:hypothetical protein
MTNPESFGNRQAVIFYHLRLNWFDFAMQKKLQRDTEVSSHGEMASDIDEAIPYLQMSLMSLQKQLTTLNGTLPTPFCPNRM